MLYYCNTVRWAWLDWGLSGWLTTLLHCFDTVGWVIRPVKTAGRITYIVLVQTLNHAQTADCTRSMRVTCSICGWVYLLRLVRVSEQLKNRSVNMFVFSEYLLVDSKWRQLVGYRGEESDNLCRQFQHQTWWFQAQAKWIVSGSVRLWYLAMWCENIPVISFNGGRPTVSCHHLNCRPGEQYIANQGCAAQQDYCSELRLIGFYIELLLRNLGICPAIQSRHQYWKNSCVIHVYTVMIVRVCVFYHSVDTDRPNLTWLKWPSNVVELHIICNSWCWARHQQFLRSVCS